MRLSVKAKTPWFLSRSPHPSRRSSQGSSRSGSCWMASSSAASAPTQIVEIAARTARTSVGSDKASRIRSKASASSVSNTLVWLCITLGIPKRRSSLCIFSTCRFVRQSTATSDARTRRSSTRAGESNRSAISRATPAAASCSAWPLFSNFSSGVGGVSSSRRPAVRPGASRRSRASGAGSAG